MRYKYFFALIFFIVFAFKSKAFAFDEVNWLNSNILGRVEAVKYKPKLQDDFYGANNLEWLKNTKLKPGHSRNSAFDELQDYVNNNIKKIMTDKNLKGHDAELVQNLYSLWLDWDKRNSEGIGIINRYIETIENIKTIKELNEYFKSRECLYYGSLIFGYSLGYDNLNSSLYNLELIATGLMLGDAAEYKNLTPNGQRTKKFQEGIASYMLRRLGYSENDAKNILEKSFAFEKSIADFMMTYDERENPEAVQKMYNPVSYAEIKMRSKNFPMAEILEAREVKSNLTNLQEPKWLEGLNSLYNADNLENIKAYLIRNTASKYITRIDEPAYREFQKLQRERSGITQSKPDEELAAEFVRSFVPVSVSKLYVKQFVPPEIKKDVQKIILDVIDYYRHLLNSEEWLSEQTRLKAIEKLNNLTPRAAYPDKWEDYSSLNIIAPQDGGTLLKAFEALDIFNRKLFLSKLNTKVDRELWISDITQVNAYYSPSNNEIKIIAGILSGDFYNPEMSIEEKLGGIGMVIGHEISHAFDTVGAQFDKNGNMKNWWTDDDYKKFQARADRLIKYLSSIKVTPEGDFYNGSLVQTETIADMAGIRAMLGLAKNYPDFDYAKFFKAYANLWKFIGTREYIDMLIKLDVHALAYLRVNVIVQQYEEFYKAFNIKAGDKMFLAPENRVAVW